MGSLMVFAKNLHIDALAVGVLWPAALSFFITVIIGYGLSLFMGKNTPETLNYTRKNVMLNKNL
jgi:hypothetical protein